MRRLLLALSLCLGQGALAQEIDRSPLPPANPRLTNVVPGDVVAADAGISVAEAAVATEAPAPDGALERSLRPVPRPAELAARLAALRATSNAPGLDLSGTVPEDEVDLASVPPPSKKEERKKKREAASRKG